MQYEAIVNHIWSLPRMEGAPTLDRMKSTLARLGHPDRDYRIIHVAGTNGKGSTSAMLASILTTAGYTTGLFTSPFLDDFTNRIKIDGEDISRADLATAFAEVRPIADETRLTQFEFITALALKYYSLRKVDAVVLEVGLGGRFDATNAISSPLLSIITNIGYDHMAILGDTLAQIAGEKAGILRPGVPAITGTEEEEALAVIEAECHRVGAPLARLRREFNYQKHSADLTGQCFSYQSTTHSLSDLCITLLGGHQLNNAALAVQASLRLSELGLHVSHEQIRMGLGAARWPGRFELMSNNPLLIMDGSHNTHGMAALRTTLDQLLPEMPLRWVAGMMADKETGPMLAYLEGRDVTMYACSPAIPRALPAEDLAATARQQGFTALAYPSVALALEQALRDWQPGEVVLVAGSLYVISEARQHWHKQQ